MKHINIENDIKPLSEFRANAANFVKQIKDTKRPIVLTQHGKSAAVLVDVSAYQAIIDELELLQEIQLAEKQISEGKVLTNNEVKKRVEDRFKI
ncbi:MAG: type II toxin-antitoxin system Phd/YefM family antitoxin [Candidatus Marinimicrobia bacterium]|nr:type II toxin-antitoxin system Phd/YefM family antitoxin [Candidatus Neomarinimicrobiota bacterium]